VFDNQDYNYRYRDNNYQRKLKSDLAFSRKNIVVTPYTGYNIYTNKLEAVTPDKAIKVNKMTRYYEELPYTQGESNIFVRNNLGYPNTGGRSNSRTNYGGNNLTTGNLVAYRNNTNYPLQVRNQYYYKKKNFRDNAENLYLNRNYYTSENNDEEGDDNEEYNNEFIVDVNDEINQLERYSLSGDENENSGREVMVENINDIIQSEIKNESMVYDIELHPKYSRLLLSSALNSHDL